MLVQVHSNVMVSYEHQINARSHDAGHDAVSNQIDHIVLIQEPLV